jgi:hypothetical protein
MVSTTVMATGVVVVDWPLLAVKYTRYGLGPP